MTGAYDAHFFRWMTESSGRSAELVVPLLVELARPRSVVDVGCGVGAWLLEFQRNGVERMLGLDGAYVDRSQLVIPEPVFRATDLAMPFRLDETFDLAISLEVAEHLPPARAASFVEELARLAPIVAFSAAIPHQGGRRHLNERWQSYWAGLFRACGFDAFDCLRDRVWDAVGVEPWYAQNLVLYARRDALAGRDIPLATLAPTDARALDRVHPRIYEARAAATTGLKQLLINIPGATRRAARKRATRTGRSRA